MTDQQSDFSSEDNDNDQNASLMSTTDYGSDSCSWIQWFCSLRGHDYFIPVSDEFIEDDFNLTGLSSIIPCYNEALDVILDCELSLTDKSVSMSLIESSAELLYYLIHQRFLLSRQGLLLMAQKYNEKAFGTCPRVLCQRTAVVPIGLSDMTGKSSVKLFCPNCVDVYNPSSSIYHGIDGAAFGTTYAHLMFKTYPRSLKLPEERSIYEPKIFGFKIHSSAENAPKMKQLRESDASYAQFALI